MISSKTQLFGEISQIAYHFHWPLDDILDLEHGVRGTFLNEIERIASRSASSR